MECYWDNSQYLKKTNFLKYVNKVIHVFNVVYQNSSMNVLDLLIYSIKIHFEHRHYS